LPPFRWDHLSVALWHPLKLVRRWVDVLSRISAHGFAYETGHQRGAPCLPSQWLAVFFSNVMLLKLVRLSFFLVWMGRPLHRSVLGVGRIAALLSAAATGRPCLWVRYAVTVRPASLPGCCVRLFHQGLESSGIRIVFIGTVSMWRGSPPVLTCLLYRSYASVVFSWNFFARRCQGRTFYHSPSTRIPWLDCRDCTAERFGLLPSNRSHLRLSISLCVSMEEPRSSE